MPELPEVETIRLGLQKSIIGLKIKNLEVLNKKTFSGDKKEIIGAKVKGVWRRAKILGIDLADPVTSVRHAELVSASKKIPKRVRDDRNGMTLLFHLKMSGQLIFIDDKKRFAGGHPTLDMKDQMPNKSTRVIFKLSDGSQLFFNDQRKFGWIKLVTRDSLMTTRLFEKLGPEPLEKNFTWQILKERLLKRKNLAVKVALMDQQLIAGIGNIYASEAMFDAKLDPRIKVKDLSDQDFKKIYQGVIKSLMDGIKLGGSSRAHFVNSEGEKGLFLDYANVYGRDKLPCKICNTTIEKVVLAGRGTYFCKNCQV